MPVNNLWPLQRSWVVDAVIGLCSFVLPTQLVFYRFGILLVPSRAPCLALACLSFGLGNSQLRVSIRCPGSGCEVASKRFRILVVFCFNEISCGNEMVWGSDLTCPVSCDARLCGCEVCWIRRSLYRCAPSILTLPFNFSARLRACFSVIVSRCYLLTFQLALVPASL